MLDFCAIQFQALCRTLEAGSAGYRFTARTVKDFEIALYLALKTVHDEGKICFDDGERKKCTEEIRSLVYAETAGLDTGLQRFLNGLGVDVVR
jgi:hypothetical protein